MITYSTNWMGPLRKDWYDKNGREWAGGRIDMRGEALGPYGDEVSAPIMDGTSWGLLTNWLSTYRTKKPDYHVLNTFQSSTGHKITFWEKD